MHLRKGTMVAVYYDPQSRVPNSIAKKYNGTIWRISRVANFGAKGQYYELEGVCSDMGVPYAFLESELTAI